MNRSPGIHLSDVIHDMDVTLLKTGERDIDEDTMFQFEKGYLWEVALSKAFGEKAAVRIGEVELDGILMSPDGVKYEGRATTVDGMRVDMHDIGAIEEYKCTALSSSKSPADNWRWMMQVKGYCKALGTTKCIFRILYHVDIMRNPGGAYGVFLLTFTQGELDENWEAVLNHAKMMRERDNG